jgi:hypothetical protein
MQARAFRVAARSVIAALAILGMPDGTTQSLAQQITVTVDTSVASHRFEGHGYQVWLQSGDEDQQALFDLLEATKTGIVRLSLFSQPDLEEGWWLRPEASLLAAIRGAYLRPASPGYPTRLAQVGKMAARLKKMGAEILAINWSAPAGLRRDTVRPGRKESRHLDPARIPDLARFIAAQIQVLRELQPESLPRYIEPINEPDGDWNTRIAPDDYARLVRHIRDSLRERGISGIGLVGPGTGTMRAGIPYVRAGAGPHAAFADLQALSVHAWDSRLADVNGIARLPDEIVKVSRALRLPIYVTEYSEDSGRWSPPAYACGPRTLISARCTGPAPFDTPGYGIAVAGQAVQLLSDGASALMLWEAQDQSWGRSFGALGPGGHRRTPAVALASFLPLVDRYAQVYAGRVEGAGDHGVHAVGFRNGDGRVVVLVAIIDGMPADAQIVVGLAGEGKTLRPLRVNCYPRCPDNTLEASDRSSTKAGTVRLRARSAVVAIIFGQ